MKRTRIHILLPAVLLVSTCLALAGCGASQDEETAPTKVNAPTNEFSYETDPYDEMSDSELTALQEKADLLNQSEDNFYGTWRGEDEEAYNLYGNLTVKVNKKGTIDFLLSDGEEEFSGKWRKTNDGIRFTSDLMSGRLFYGEYCEMTIDNSEWDYDDEDTGMAVTLKKVK